MEDLVRALAARGLNFTPNFDSELITNGDEWFLGWSSVGVDGPLLEARFGTGTDSEKWVSGSDGPGDDALAARDLHQTIVNRHMAAMILAESAQPASPTLFELPASSDFPRPKEIIDKKGNVTPPPQQMVADCLIEGFGNNFCRDGEDPFYWQDTHWQPRNPGNFRHYLCNMAQFLRSGQARAAEVTAISSLFMNRCHALADNHTFYQQNPYLANFLDGTLEVIKEPGGKYRKEFREHRREDLLTWVLPYKYRASRKRNPLFEEWIKKAFEEDADGAGKVRALKQIGGACLISTFPRIAILLSNEGGTGKSTFAKLCMRFMGQENYSSVPPHLMDGFHLESLIGKQANIVTDIGKKAVVPEDFFKLVEDGLPIHVNRKGRKAISARIPALHLFCANALPRGIDGESNAMDRRVTIVEFTKSMLGAEEGAYTRDYEEVLLGGGPGAILDFFEDGLDDLLASGGLYFNPESGKDALRQWKDNESLTAQFIEALLHGEIGPENSPFVVSKDAKILRSKLSNALATWAGRALPNQQINRMFQELNRRGYPHYAAKGRRFISGIKDTGVIGSGDNW